MKVEISGLDKLFLAFGIKRREEKAKLIYDPLNNKKFNRYIAYQVSRMERSNNLTL
jgi:hypothetical protein